MSASPREEVLQYGLLPCSALVPGLDGLASLAAIHEGLVKATLPDDQGERECGRRLACRGRMAGPHAARARPTGADPQPAPPGALPAASLQAR
jgi:hypothetical protein